MTDEKGLQIRSKKSATFLPKLKYLKKGFLQNLVDTFGYSTQSSCLVQIETADFKKFLFCRVFYSTSPVGNILLFYIFFF